MAQAESRPRPDLGRGQSGHNFDRVTCLSNECGHSRPLPPSRLHHSPARLPVATPTACRSTLISDRPTDAHATRLSLCRASLRRRQRDSLRPSTGNCQSLHLGPRQSLSEPSLLPARRDVFCRGRYVSLVGGAKCWWSTLCAMSLPPIKAGTMTSPTLSEAMHRAQRRRNVPIIGKGVAREESEAMERAEAIQEMRKAASGAGSLAKRSKSKKPDSVERQVTRRESVIRRGSKASNVIKPVYKLKCAARALRPVHLAAALCTPLFFDCALPFARVQGCKDWGRGYSARVATAGSGPLSRVRHGRERLRRCGRADGSDEM